MTAEIAVLNLSAVALAADSAATYGNKIYSADKLFALSKYQPVGIMVYGNSGFCGIPFETIIKKYRQETGDSKEKTVKDYAEKFRTYISQEWICSKEQQKTFALLFAISVFNTVKRHIEENITSQFKRSAKHVSRTALIQRPLDQMLANIKKLPALDSVAKINSTDILKEYKSEFEQAVRSVFKDNAIPLTAGMKSTLVQIAQTLFTKDISSQMHSGIVIAGFGDDDIFPKLVDISVDGVIMGNIRWKIERIIEPDREKSRASIIPFAQKDMMWRFVEGIDEKYSDFLDSSISKMLSKFGVGIINKYVAGTKSKKRAIITKVEEAIKAAHTEFVEDARKFRYDKFVKPLTDVLVTLPKEDLASLADSLVSLTSLKRRMSMTDRETVGGPVDVAVISKGDGFVWIKRKHYFDKDLNPHFATNYFRQ